MKTQTLNIALPDELVAKVDQVARKEYRNRSELIREALRVYLSRVEKWDAMLAKGKEYGRRLNISSEKDVERVLKEYRNGK